MNDASNTSNNGRSRREFLQHSAGAAVVAATAASALRVPAAYAAASDEIKVARIGCGGRGTGAAKNALDTEGPVKLIAVADAFEDNAKKAVENLKNDDVGSKVDVKPENIFHGFDSYQKAIDSGA